METLRVAVAQMNPTVGSFGRNVSRILSFVAKATESKAQLLVCPELSLTGYPPEDLILKPSFLNRCRDSLLALAAQIGPLPVLVGFVEQAEEMVYDSAALLQNGAVVAVYRKLQLPNYGVFDEKRYFTAGRKGLVVDAGAIRIGITICEDIWLPDGPHLKEVRQGGANLVVNLSASPYHRGKWRERLDLIRLRACDCGAAIVYANMVGGQDDLVFDGHSLVVDASGSIRAQGQGFIEQLLVVDLDLRAASTLALSTDLVEECRIELPEYPPSTRLAPLVVSPGSEEEEVYRALVLGTRDYAEKNGFTDALLGLSGGIDSALVASLAVDALGEERVHALFMPSAYTSQESWADADAIVANLGIELKTLPIDDVFANYRELLAPSFRGLEEDITEENLQARIRGNLLMAHSNKLGYLVLATGNKSEMACGYATLYGDMVGGFAVIKDVPKTMVFRLVRYRNSVANRPWLPERLLTKAPSAELRPNQKDSDSLPPYEVLDPILEAYVEEDLPLDDIVGRGFKREVVSRVIRLVDGAEYKRRQAPPGVKITPRAFGRDRRLPITNGFSEEE